MNGLSFKKGDFVVIAAVIISSLALIFVTGRFSGNNAGDKVVIEIDGQKSEYSLSQYRNIEIENDGISLTLAITDGGAEVIKANCPDHICVHTGNISRSGERIVCIPARFTAQIVSTGDEIIVAG